MREINNFVIFVFNLCIKKIMYGQDNEAKNVSVIFNAIILLMCTCTLFDLNSVYTSLVLFLLVFA